MINKFDYNSDDVMKILNNPEYSDEQKKQLFEKYKEDLKLKRKNEIIVRLNECAKENPIITEEDYVNVIKRYSDDDLSKPFEIIETEIRTFEENMKRKYQEYLMTQEQSKLTTEPKEDIIEEPVIDNNVQEELEDVLFTNDQAYKLTFVIGKGNKDTCPNCGAILEDSKIRECPYCKSHVTPKPYHYALSSVDIIESNVDTIE